MAEYNSNTPTQVRKNQVITADMLNNIANSIVGRIIGGRGISVRRISNNIVIESIVMGSVGGASVSAILVVETLPPIPNAGMEEVYWTSVGAGTGDDQVWRAYAGQSSWTPTQKLTTLSGVVV